METITFDKLLMTTAFCCMASDGNIDAREIALIKKLCQDYELFNGFDFEEDINSLVNQINEGGKSFISKYLTQLLESQLSHDQQLIIIDFAIQTIHADDQIEYSEIKFFKTIRHRLTISDVEILKKFPEIELFLENDIIAENLLDEITSHYLDNINFPKFDLVQLIQK